MALVVILPILKILLAEKLEKPFKALLLQHRV